MNGKMIEKPMIEGLELPRMTVKQSKWLKIFLESGNATKAAREIYDCKDDESASSIGNQNFRKLGDGFRLLLETHGLSYGALVAVVGRAINAKKLEDLSGEKVDDFKIQLAAADRLARWLKVETPIPQQTQAQQVVINVTRGEDG